MELKKSSMWFFGRNVLVESVLIEFSVFNLILIIFRQIRRYHIDQINWYMDRKKLQESLLDLDPSPDECDTVWIKFEFIFYR